MEPPGTSRHFADVGLMNGGKISALGHPGTVQKPADDQESLGEAAQTTGTGSGATSLAFAMQQRGHEQHGLLEHGQDRHVCHTGGHVGLPMKLISWKRPLHTGASPISLAAQHLPRVVSGLIRRPHSHRTVARNGSLCIGLLDNRTVRTVSYEGAIVSETDSPGFDAILFDLGGVLMNFGGLQRLAELAGEEDGPALRSKWVTSKWVQAFERGKCDAATFGEGVATDWGFDLTPAEFVDDFARWPAGPFAGSIELAEAFTGLPRWDAERDNPAHPQQHLERWGVVGYFDWTFVSHELGLMKPDMAMFRHVIRTIGTAADRLLFLDDCNEHVLAARKLGIHAVQVRRERGARRAGLASACGLERGPRPPVYTFTYSRAS